jgi:hypothetical protein
VTDPATRALLDAEVTRQAILTKLPQRLPAVVSSCLAVILLLAQAGCGYGGSLNAAVFAEI